MPPATNLSTDSFMPPFLDVPSEPGPPGSWQAQAYHYARASTMHLSELERKEQYITKLERRLTWYQAQIARLKDAYPPQQTTGDSMTMFWILKATTDLQGRARVAIVNAATGAIVDLYWPEQEAAALTVCNNYNSTIVLAREMEKWGLFAAAA